MVTVVFFRSLSALDEPTIRKNKIVSFRIVLFFMM